MKIIYEIRSSRWEDKDIKMLKEAGIKVKSKDLVYVRLNEEQFKLVRTYFKERKFIMGYGTEFTKGEMEEAKWFTITGNKEYWYPQPEDDFGYREMTYDLSRSCDRCGIGRIQNAPFRIKGEPKWGKWHIFNLFWVYDEFFVHPEFYEQVFKKFDIGARQVIIHKKNEIAKNTVQLDLLITQESIDLNHLEFELCTKCNVKKYRAMFKGFFPNYNKYNLGHMFKTNEQFGSGGRAFRQTIISQELRNAINSYKPRQNILVHPLSKV